MSQKYFQLLDLVEELNQLLYLKFLSNISDNELLLKDFQGGLSIYNVESSHKIEIVPGNLLVKTLKIFILQLIPKFVQSFGSYFHSDDFKFQSTLCHQAESLSF